MKHINKWDHLMPLGHYLSVGKLELESALSEGTKKMRA
jgi:hypothetical protein